MAHGKATGRPRSALDTIVAAIAQSNSCIVITDNERDFQGIDINERGKGDHIHLDGEEYPYRFTTLDQLIEDFMSEIEKRRQS